MRSTLSACISVVALVGAGVGLGGCGKPWQDFPVGTYERGHSAFEDGYYTEAVQDLKLFIRRAPTDDLADDAQFHVGRCHMEAEDYPLAAVEFEILRADFPDSELIEESWYQQGLCYARQVPNRKNDQKVTRQGVQHFHRFLREFPDGDRREDAQRELEKLESQLDAKDLETARFYLQIDRYEAAKVTANAFLIERPQSPLRPEMLDALATASLRLGELGEARDAWTEIVSLVPERELALRAQEMLNNNPPSEPETEP